MRNMSANSVPQKLVSDHFEVVDVPVQNESSAAVDEELIAFDRKMLLKLDIALVPMMAMLYLLAFLDRANIGNARVVS